MSTPNVTERPRTFLPAVASTVLGFAALVLERLYGRIHWGLIFRHDNVPLPDPHPAREVAYELLTTVAYLRFGVATAALIIAVWGLRGFTPRWAGLASVGFAMWVFSITTFLLT